MAGDRPLAGKTVFVAGGSSGINLGIARRFARDGANVTVISRSAEKIEAAAAELRSLGGGDAMGFSADVRDYAAVEATLKATHNKCSRTRGSWTCEARWSTRACRKATSMS